MQSILKSYDEHESNLLLSRNAREWENSEEAMKEDAKEMLSTLDLMVSQLNILMSNAHAIDILDYYKIEKATLHHSYNQ